MPVKMGVSTDALEGIKPVPAGVYEVQLAGFEPKFAKNKESYNLNPVLKIVNSPDYNGQRIFYLLNTKAAWLWHDFCHCFGYPVSIDGEEVNITGGADAWQGTDDPTTWKYNGPLLGKVGKVEVVETRSPGQKPRNEIKQFICKIEGCSTQFPDITHNPNLIK